MFLYIWFNKWNNIYFFLYLDNLMEIDEISSDLEIDDFSSHSEMDESFSSVEIDVGPS